jgi:hypothetical protein
MGLSKIAPSDPLAKLKINQLDFNLRIGIGFRIKD